MSEVLIVNRANGDVRTGELSDIVCPGGCGNIVSCTCWIEEQHAKGCRYRIAATMPFELACDHGYQACPACDPCTCGATAPLRPVL